MRAPLLIFLLALPVPLQAQANPVSTWKARGAGPDAQLLGGGGFGLDEQPDNHFLGRVRLGLLYASEPWIYHAGATGDVGGIADWGFGGELEVNHFKGWFAAAGLGTAQLKDVTGHLTAGYTIFGVEYQFRARPQKANHALMFVVRAPVGMWWFMMRQRNKQEEDRESRKAGAVPSSPKLPQQEEKQEPGPRTNEMEAIRAESERTRARLHVANNDWASAEQALGRAYALDPRPELLLELAEIELKQGRMVAAVDDFQRFIESAESDADRARVPEVTETMEGLRPRIGRIRVTLLSVQGGESVRVDDRIERGATLGYDVRVDPGDRHLTVVRGDQVVARRQLRIAEGALVRVRIDLDAPAAVTDAAAAPTPSEPGDD